MKAFQLLGRKSIILLAFVLLMPAMQVQSKNTKPKYIFYFIGDGMGTGSILAAQYFKAGNTKSPEIAPLCFTQFPYSAFVVTHSSDSGVTDSAAGGTALATGSKTSSRTIAMLPDRETILESVAKKAHEKGWRVGIGTTCCIDDATPAVFYSNAKTRYEHHDIGMQLPESGFEYFGGYGFRQERDKKEPAKDSGVVAYAKEKGYTVVNTYNDFKQQYASAARMLMFQPQEGSNEQIPFAIDSTDRDLTISQIFNAGYDFLFKEKGNVFYMFEGGSIDHASHGNDGATAINELLAFDACIQRAFEFYQEHKDQTLIVVTADHSTSGFTLGDGGYYLNIPVLANQKMSENAFTAHLKSIVQSEGRPSWERVKQELTENFGFWDKVRISRSQEQALKEAYEKSFSDEGINEEVDEEALYSYYKTDKLSDCAVKIISDIAQIAWSSGDHDGGYVPLFAIGAGAENFHGQIQNTQVVQIISELAGF
ncbi:MAG: alkaline phosphatase [Bacteroidaceae bacterium]|nr:alkaline phosphatase [Bacteroidaceae bacterium]